MRWRCYRSRIISIIRMSQYDTAPFPFLYLVWLFLTWILFWIRAVSAMFVSMGRCMSSALLSLMVRMACLFCWCVVRTSDVCRKRRGGVHELRAAS